MSEAQSTSERPSADKQGESAPPAPKKKTRSFATIIKGVFQSPKPKIIPDDLVATPTSGSSAQNMAGTSTDDGASTDKRQSPTKPADSARPGPQSERDASSTAAETAEAGNSGGREKEASARTTTATQDQGTPTLSQRSPRLIAKTAPLWVVLVLLALLVAAVVWAFNLLLGQGALQSQRATQKPILAAPNTSEYSDDLNAFSITFAKAEPWVAEPATAPNCVGTTFALDEQGLQVQDPKYPRLRVCFLDFQLNQPWKSLNEFLDERLASPMGLQVLEANQGLIRDVEVGTSGTGGRGAFLLGIDAESSRPTKWYVAIANFEGRIYSVEAVATQDEWNSLWPKFARLIERVSFGSGVVRPLPTPIVID